MRYLTLLTLGVGLVFADSAAAQTAGDTLTLRGGPRAYYQVQNAAGRLYRIDDVRADANGGVVDVTYFGTGTCKGRVQHARFKWMIQPGVARLAVAHQQPAFLVWLSIEGDRDGCMQGNPWFSAGGDGNTLQRTPVGEGRFYAFENPNHTPGPRTFTYHRMPVEQGAQFAVRLLLPGDPGQGGDLYAIEYLFDAAHGGEAPPPGARLTPATVRYVEQARTPQGEARDASGRITVEAALIHQVLCQNGAVGRRIFVYEYTNRPGFRAILPPDWGRPLGGRDFGTFAEATAAGCSP